jgi:hypothetical protein
MSSLPIWQHFFLFPNATSYSFFNFRSKLYSVCRMQRVLNILQRARLSRLGSFPPPSPSASFPLFISSVSPTPIMYVLQESPFASVFNHRLNMELDLRSLFGLLCTAVLIGWGPATPPPAFGLIYEGSIGQP